MSQTATSSTTPVAQPVDQADHAFPMLSAAKAAYPPHFRFMWIQR